MCWPDIKNYILTGKKWTHYNIIISLQLIKINEKKIFFNVLVEMKDLDETLENGDNS